VVITTSQLALGSWLGSLESERARRQVGGHVTDRPGAQPERVGANCQPLAGGCRMQPIALRDVLTHPGGLRVLGELVH
jgi:hypothetical protein